MPTNPKSCDIATPKCSDQESKQEILVNKIIIFTIFIGTLAVIKYTDGVVQDPIHFRIYLDKEHGRTEELKFLISRYLCTTSLLNEIIRKLQKYNDIEK